jgi:hypothetical protein
VLVATVVVEVELTVMVDAGALYIVS